MPSLLVSCGKCVVRVYTDDCISRFSIRIQLKLHLMWHQILFREEKNAKHMLYAGMINVSLRFGCVFHMNAKHYADFHLIRSHFLRNHSTMFHRYVCLRGPNESYRLCFAYKMCGCVLFTTRFRSNPFGIHIFGKIHPIWVNLRTLPRIAIRIHISISLFSDCVDACKDFNGNVSKERMKTATRLFSQ